MARRQGRFGPGAKNPNADVEHHGRGNGPSRPPGRPVAGKAKGKGRPNFTNPSGPKFTNTTKPDFTHPGRPDFTHPDKADFLGGWPKNQLIGGFDKGGHSGNGNGNGKPKDPPYKQSVYDRIVQRFKQYGLPITNELIKVIKQGLIGGETPESIRLAVQDTKTWKERFAGNEMLRKKGLGVLSVGEYLALEKQYANIMQAAGTPKGFYDDPADFAKWIGSSVSPAELQSRVGSAMSIVNSEDPNVMRELRRMGLNKGDLLANVLAPKRALPLIQAKMRQVQYGAMARGAGVVGTRGMLKELSSATDENGTPLYSQQQIQQGYGQIGDFLEDANELGEVYGIEYGTGTAEQEIFKGNAGAREKREQIASRETAAFSGQSVYGVTDRSATGSY